ncbi:MAG: c-type cytochrome [Pedosphaera sp.]|nr:c-type cytochrome [Pedosphaera sp.]
MRIQFQKEVATRVVLCVTALVTASSVHGQPNLNSPEYELSTLKVADGYQINLFAAEPMIVKPIQMQFDPRGRLWVLSTTAYPQIKPGEKPEDRLVILEDTNGDGQADKATDFASGLAIPTGLAIGDNGAYIGHGTELIHLKDTDGDGKADQTRVILGGFGTGDSHQNINSFTWSPGGELFFSQGHNIYSLIETMAGVKSLNRAGVWRFRPGAVELDSFFNESSGPLNPWGIAFDYWGQPLLVDGCCYGISYLLPVMVQNKPMERFQELWKGKKICGVDLLSGRHYSGDEQGIMVGGTFFNNSVSRWRITDDGSGFAAQELPSLIETTNRNFRIVDVKIGPDGAIYLADWYNPIVGHYQYSFRHPDRDRTHGRIWRVTKKNSPLAERPRLVGVPLQQVLDHLKSPENYARAQARRVLSEWDREPLDIGLKKWLGEIDGHEPGYEHHLLEALMVYESRDKVEVELLKQLLRARDYHARAYSTRLVGRWHSRLESPLELLEAQLKDSQPRVRLEAVIALSYIRSPRAMEIALMAVDQPMDRFLDYGLRQAVQGLKAYWAPSFSTGKLTFDHNQKRLEFLIKADGSEETLKSLVDLITSGTLSKETLEKFLSILADVGGPEQLALVLDSKTYNFAGGYDAAMHARLLPALAGAERLRKARPSGDLASSVASLLSQPDENLRGEALKLGGVWKIESLRPQMAKIAEANDVHERLRQAAMDGIASLSGDQSKDLLLRLCAGTQPENIRLAAISRLTAVDLNAAAGQAARELAASSGGVDPRELFSAFLQRSNGARALSTAFSEIPPLADAAKLGLRWMNSVGRQDAPLVEILGRAAGISGEAKEMSPQELKTLTAEVRAKGDRKRGAAVFRRPDVNCLACHTVGNEGGRIGPDLNAIGTGQPIDFIIGAVLTPNKEIKEGYMSFEVTTKDGKVYQGYKVRESTRELVLRDVLKNDETRIRAVNIKGQRALGSLMPTGLVNHLTHAEFVDLIRYLSELGTPPQ